MGQVQYQTGMSLDGFIAGPGGDMSWLAAYAGGPSPAVEHVRDGTGALIIGNRTFGGDDPNKGTAGEGKPYGGGWDGQQFVLTHRPPAAQYPGITFVGDLHEAIAAARAAAGRKNVGILGADVARQALEAGLADEILVFIAPVLLGDGIRLFDHPGGATIRLERVSQSAETQSIVALYRVVK